ncbi:hypothetical protein [Parageobacillus thermoglucosidasius]|uniref:Uncharacterized protein n=1 Tax=Parageobacillus thermoglucosidasius TaxID=1426 RepID=A0AB38R439_PARTM|nr:hypothetical protein [Parageobacillus thermoglucosidasius]UOE78389.1 hypothetical protein IMI45_20345 [Parageobacillus thermoglucosidasius]
MRMAADFSSLLLFLLKIGGESVGRTANGENGYTPGVQCPFTPSRKATWTDDFNRLLEQEGISRNKLTEILIQEALENRTKKVVKFDCSELSSEEIELLQNPIIQRMVIQMIKNIGLNQPNVTIKQEEKKVASVLEEQTVVQETIAATKEETTEREQKVNVNLAALERFKKIRGSME